MKEQKDVATKTIYVSKKLLKQALMIALEGKMQALVKQDKGKYLYYFGYEVALKNLSTLKEEE